VTSLAGAKRPYLGTGSAVTAGSSAAEAIRAGLVNIKSNEATMLSLVKPGDPTNSYLLIKMQGTQASADCSASDIMAPPLCGALMPSTSTTPLPQATLAIVHDWISQGALDN
jgi:hypothetical protein